MAIALRVGEIAKEQGLTIKALAERAGVAYNTAHALFTGRATRIDLDTLDRICVALRVEPGDLLIRQAITGPAGRARESEGGYGTDGDRAASAGDRRSAGAL